MGEINKNGYLSVPVIWGDEDYETREVLAENVKPMDLVSFEEGDYGNVYLVWSVDVIPGLLRWNSEEQGTMYRLNCNQGATSGPFEGDSVAVVVLSDDEYSSRVQSHYLRWVLSEALKRHGSDNIFIGTEHVNAACHMSRDLSISGEVPWGLDKIQLRTLVIGLRWWDASTRKGYYNDRWPQALKELYGAVEKAVKDAYRAACHADGQTWK
ncbi:hypothetical protein [Streptomyces decoyicus]